MGISSIMYVLLVKMIYFVFVKVWVAAVDFPSKWDNLLPELVQKFNSLDPSVVQGVLLTANSIIKRF